MQTPPETPIPEDALPPSLKRLRLLVTVLTVVMIAGVITIIALLVIRLSADTRVVVVDPAGFSTPDGVGTLGYSVVGGRAVLVGDDGVIRVYDSDSRALVQEFDLDN
ncbi:MAG: DUF6476 family protein [Roseicyclus sp.]|jgi:uncharacterized integral membrane protein